MYGSLIILSSVDAAFDLCGSGAGAGAGYRHFFEGAGGGQSQNVIKLPVTGTFSEVPLPGPFEL